MTASKRAWETYPPDYRAKEIACVANWIRAGESGSIVGLAGTGKSNLLGFLCHRPEVIAQYLRDRSSSLALILADLNALPSNDLSTFYRFILRSLYEARAQLAAIGKPLGDAIEAVYHRVELSTDSFASQSALRETLFGVKERGARLVLVLDPFDQFCRTATTQVLDNLRGLRDGFKSTISYVVGLRQELACIRNLDELGELYEILDAHTCWVGPMERSDARWVISQVEETVGQPFEEDQAEQLIDLTGGYPSLLRAASLWLARALPGIELKDWMTLLLGVPSVQNRLQELWQGLTGEEQLALFDLWVVQKDGLQAKPVDRGAGKSKSYESVCRDHCQVLARLQEKGVCCSVEQGAWRIRSPLFAAYVGRRTSSGRIHHQKADDVILRGKVSLETALPPQCRRLLLFFLENPHRVVSKDEIALVLWPEDEVVAKDRGIDDVRLQQAVSQLRRVLEKGEDSPCYIETARGTGYRFFPEGAPRGRDR